jgi:trigger factor
MSVKVEKTENKNELKLEFVVEAQVFDEGIKTVFNKNAKHFNIPGFRKGKAPIHIVEKYYGNEIFYEDTFNEIVPEIYDEAIKEQNLEVVSKPNIDITQIGKGQDLIFTAIVQTKPEVELGKYKAVAVEKNIYEVTEHVIEHELEHMADKNSRMVTVTDRSAKEADTVIIDYVGSVEGIEFPGGTAENYELVLGSNSFIPGFETGVVGMKTEETKEINVKFPADYFSKDLADKDAIFKVTVHEIKEKEIPKIDDEFAKDVSEFETLKDLKTDIKTKKEEKNADRTKNELKEAAIKKVCEDSKVNIPSGMIETELDNMVTDMDRRLSYQGMNLEQYLKMLNKTMDDFRNESKEGAEFSVKMRLVLEAIFNETKLEVTDKDVSDKVAELVTAYGRKEEDITGNEMLMKHIKDSLKTEKSINYIIENAKITEVKKEEECEHSHK